ncbi:hypothetical protein QE152_g23112 [Popillia japonica]|uniref:Uncharacterized protein n=1 Tax=Popillia japonica TaxID=7064 RepID=A0AAW1KJT0_POPJA
MDKQVEVRDNFQIVYKVEQKMSITEEIFITTAVKAAIAGVTTTETAVGIAIMVIGATLSKGREVIISRDVEFNEKVFWYTRKIDVVNDDEDGENDKENEMEDDYQDTVIDDESEGDDTVLGESDTEKRRVKMPIKYKDYEMYMALVQPVLLKMLLCENEVLKN